MGMVNAQTGAFDEEIIRTLGYMSCFVGGKSAAIRAYLSVATKARCCPFFGSVREPL